MVAKVSIPNRKKLIQTIGWVGGLLLLLSLALYRLLPFSAFDDYYEIGFIINSKEMRGNDLEVVRKLMEQQLKQINRNGGVRGRQLRLRYLDDGGSANQAYRLVKESIRDPRLIAYMGCWSSARTLAFAPLLQQHRVPHLGGYALTPLFKEYPTMFTTETGIEQVTEAFVRLLEKKASKVAFIGKSGDFYSQALVRRLREQRMPELMLERWYSSDHAYTEEDIGEIVQAVQQGVDFVVVSFETAPTIRLVGRLRQAGVAVPVFTGLAEISPVLEVAGGEQLGELYDLTVAGIPGAQNARLRERIDLLRGQFTVVLEHQVAFSSRYADAMGMIAEAAAAFPGMDVRQSITEGLQLYVGGVACTMVTSPIGISIRTGPQPPTCWSPGRSPRSPRRCWRPSSSCIPRTVLLKCLFTTCTSTCRSWTG